MPPIILFLSPRQTLLAFREHLTVMTRGLFPPRWERKRAREPETTAEELTARVTVLEEQLSRATLRISQHSRNEKALNDLINPGKEKVVELTEMITTLGEQLGSASRQISQ